METNFDNAFALTVGEEGGFSNEPSDKGNWTGGQVGTGTLKGTKFGISAASYPNVDIADLTLAEAKTIYHADYWIPAGCSNLEAGVDASVFDFAVNAGCATAAKTLQGIVGCNIDGVVGIITDAAARGMGAQTVINRFASARVAFYQAAAKNNPNETYALSDWLKRTEDVRLACQDMIVE